MERKQLLMALKCFDSIEEAVKECFGPGVTVTGSSYVSGGDINDASCISLSNNENVFVKSNTIKNREFFDAEEYGLNVIASTGTIKTPGLICKGVDRSQNRSFLMMEMIEPGRGSDDTMRTFGHELAAMHRADTSGFTDNAGFGFSHDNFIGASKQINTPKDTWIGFFRQCRLEPQFKMAEGYFDSGFIRVIMHFLDRLDDLLIEPDHPSLLHGDLWSGNYIVDKDGKAYLIDPAAYVGSAEADLAMTELFGRFPHSFYQAYYEDNPMSDGYEDRRQIYNLYHLTNHLNLFGSSYLHSVISTVRYYAG